MKVERSTMNWWLFVVSGLIAIGYGIAALFVPEDTLGALFKWSGIVLMVIGALGIAFAFWRRFNMYPFLTLLLYSVVVLGMGCFLLTCWRSAVKFLVIVLGVWSVLSGLLQFFSAFKFKGMPGKWFYIICSLVGVAFGVLLLFNPFETVRYFVMVTGCMALLLGVVMIIFGIHLNILSRSVVEIKED